MGARARPRRRALGAVLALALVGSVCSDDGADSTAAEVSRTDEAEAELAPATRVVDDEDAEDLEILDDRIVIPAGHELTDVEAGDVLTVGLTDQTPNGLLRLVTAVDDEDGQVVASTRQALLGEAFDELDLSSSVPVRFGRVVPAAGGDAQGSRPDQPTSAGGARVATVALAEPAAQDLAEEESDAIEVQENDEGFVVSFDRILHDGDDDPSTTDDNVTISGDVTVEVSLDLELAVDIDLADLNADLLDPLSVVDPKLERAKLEVDGNVSTNLQFDARQATPPFDGETELFAIEGTPIVIPVGGVPVVIRVRIPLVVGWGGRVSAAVDTSVTTSTGVRLGVEYDDGEWDPIEQVDPPAYDVNPPELEDADPGFVEVRVGPRIEVRLWEHFASGVVGVDGTLRADLLDSSPWVCLYAGYRATVGFDFVGEPVYDAVPTGDPGTLLFPEECDAGAALPTDVVPVAGYSRVFGTCTPLGAPVREAGRRVAALSDGGVVVAAGMARPDPQDAQEARFEDLWIVRLDAAGNLLWTRTYRGFVGELVGLVPTPQGFVVALETGRMLFLDHRGDILDARRLGGLAFLLRGLRALPGGEGFLALGVEGTDPVLAELGPDGNARWARRYEGDIADGGARAASRRDDGGWNVAIGGGDFLGVDASGGLDQAVRLLVDGVPVPGGGTRAAGAAGTLARMVDRATVIVDAALENAVGSNLGPAGWGSSVHGRADGDFVSAGASGAGLLAARIASTGALRWVVGYESGDDARISFPGITSTSDGGIVAVGWTAALATERCDDEVEQGESPPLDASDLWVVKLPSTGLMTPADDSGLRRASLNREETNDRTYELVPIQARDEAFPLEVASDDPATVITHHPSVDSHLPDAVEGTPERTIPAGQFEPHEPIRVVYEYTKGGPVSERVAVAWDGDNLSVTHFGADMFNRGAPQGSFRYVFGPDVSVDGAGCYLEEATGCGQRLFSRSSSTNSAFFPPGPGGNFPRFEGALPAIEVTRPGMRAGLEVACGIAVDELLGEIELCVHEATGVILYAHTITTCNDPERTDDSCVELGAVEIGDPTAEDFRLPGQ